MNYFFFLDTSMMSFQTKNNAKPFCLLLLFMYRRGKHVIQVLVAVFLAAPQLPQTFLRLPLLPP